MPENLDQVGAPAAIRQPIRSVPIRIRYLELERQPCFMRRRMSVPRVASQMRTPDGASINGASGEGAPDAVNLRNRPREPVADQTLLSVVRFRDWAALNAGEQRGMCAATTERRQLEPSKRTPSVALADKGPIRGHRSPMGLVAEAENARHVLGRVRLWGRQLWITRWGRRLWWTMRMHANEGVCSVEITNKSVGFFAQMTWCLCILRYCERHDLIPDIRLTGDIYFDHDKGQNWLDYYFDVFTPVTLEEVARRVRYTKKIIDFYGLGLPIAPRMSIDDAARTLHKYLRPKPRINTMVDEFWRSLNVDGPVVGVHFRGTDKSSEAPRVSWQHFLKILQNYLCSDNTINAVFVASDENAFINFIKKSVKDVPVYSHNDHYRSSGDLPVHLAIDRDGGYGKGEDALVNALVLSKCSILIRTTSFLSAWASIFNPDLKVILLNRPYHNKLWFPESEIFLRRDTEYLPERPL